MPVAPEEKQIEAAKFVESALAARASIFSRIKQARRLFREIREITLGYTHDF